MIVKKSLFETAYLLFDRFKKQNIRIFALWAKT